jgi:hypothetical protein
MVRFFALCLLFHLSATSQQYNKWSLEAISGTSSYIGDLVQGDFPLKRLGLLLGSNLKYKLSPRFIIRSGIFLGKIYGDDKKNKDPELIERNLNFHSNILVGNIGCEFNIIDWEKYYYSPYLFVGVGGYYNNPFTYDDNNNKTYLRPICTEGQGLPEYPDRKKYSLFQFCIPVGVGIKYEIRTNIVLSYEFNYHILFTDYLDDVSTTYVSLDRLKEVYGETSANLSFRVSHCFGVILNSCTPSVNPFNQRTNSFDVITIYF